MPRNVIVTRDFDFCFAHRLPDYVGKCANIHGHNALVSVEVLGDIAETGSNAGMTIPFAELKKGCEAVADVFDHMLILRHTDRLVDTLFDDHNLGNAGVEGLMREAREAIPKQGYWTSFHQSHPVTFQAVNLVLIAENPTSENMAFLIHRMLSGHLKSWDNITHIKVRFQETFKCGAIYMGAKAAANDFPSL